MHTAPMSQRAAFLAVSMENEENAKLSHGWLRVKHFCVCVYFLVYHWHGNLPNFKQNKDLSNISIL